MQAADQGAGAEMPHPPSRAWLLWLRNPQTWRLASGLVLFAFVLTHFLNHALGHVSLEAMQQGQALRRAVWGSWPGTLLLYGAVAVHVGLAPRYTTLLRAIELWGAVRADGPGRLAGDEEPPAVDGVVAGREENFSQQIKADPEDGLSAAFVGLDDDRPGVH